MNKEQVRETALSIVNGDSITIEYEKPMSVFKRDSAYLNSIGITVDKKNMSDDDKAMIDNFLAELRSIKNIVKRSIVKTSYDTRNYFRQVLETSGINLNPKKQESDYEHIKGVLYRHKKSGAEYVRVCNLDKRIDRSRYYKLNNKLADYKDVEKFIVNSDRENYESYNRQTDSGVKIKAENEVIQLTYKLENVKSLTVE